MKLFKSAKKNEKNKNFINNKKINEAKEILLFLLKT